MSVPPAGVLLSQETFQSLCNLLESLKYSQPVNQLSGSLTTPPVPDRKQRTLDSWVIKSKDNNGSSSYDKLASQTNTPQEFSQTHRSQGDGPNIRSTETTSRNPTANLVPQFQSSQANEGEHVSVDFTKQSPLAKHNSLERDSKNVDSNQKSESPSPRLRSKRFKGIKSRALNEHPDDTPNEVDSSEPKNNDLPDDCQILSKEDVSISLLESYTSSTKRRKVEKKKCSSENTSHIEKSREPPTIYSNLARTDVGESNSRQTSPSEQFNSPKLKKNATKKDKLSSVAYSNSLSEEHCSGLEKEMCHGTPLGETKSFECDLGNTVKENSLVVPSLSIGDPGYVVRTRIIHAVRKRPYRPTSKALKVKIVKTNRILNRFQSIAKSASTTKSVDNSKIVTCRKRKNVHNRLSPKAQKCKNNKLKAKCKNVTTLETIHEIIDSSEPVLRDGNDASISLKQSFRTSSQEHQAYINAEDDRNNELNNIGRLKALFSKGQLKLEDLLKQNFMKKLVKAGPNARVVVTEQYMSKDNVLMGPSLFILKPKVIGPVT